MKKGVFFALVSFFSNAQETDKRWMYHVGAGPAIEGIQGMWALNITNEPSYYMMASYKLGFQV